MTRGVNPDPQSFAEGVQCCDAGYSTSFFYKLEMEVAHLGMGFTEPRPRAYVDFGCLACGNTTHLKFGASHPNEIIDIACAGGPPA